MKITGRRLLVEGVNLAVLGLENAARKNGKSALADPYLPDDIKRVIAGFVGKPLRDFAEDAVFQAWV